VPKSFEEAERWYRRSAEQGFAGAQRALGFVYASGRGLVRDDVAAVG